LVPTDSTTEVAYVAAIEETKEIVWLRKLLKELQEKQINQSSCQIIPDFMIELSTLT